MNKSFRQSKLITIVGNSGVGKTTLTQALCHRLNLVKGLEQHEERPFQKLFSGNLQRYSLANQVDYLLYRAEQEIAIRCSGSLGIQVRPSIFRRKFNIPAGVKSTTNSKRASSDSVITNP